jgi:hypothetical protein
VLSTINHRPSRASQTLPPSPNVQLPCSETRLASTFSTDQAICCIEANRQRIVPGLLLDLRPRASLRCRHATELLGRNPKSSRSSRSFLHPHPPHFPINKIARLEKLTGAAVHLGRPDAVGCVPGATVKRKTGEAAEGKEGKREGEGYLE